MSWKKLLAEHEVHTHSTSKKELDALREVVARDLADAGIKGLSADRRFATAYNAALQTAKVAIACAGYRLASTPGHHRLTFEAAHLALGPGAAKSLDYLEACRRKRNDIDYDHASVATETEAAEMLAQAHRFLELVEQWIAAHQGRLIGTASPTSTKSRLFVQVKVGR